jgi:hypothetical protein
MATRQAKFTAIPPVPQSGTNQWEYSTLSALKDNVELLIGARGDLGYAGRAVTKGQITVAEAPTQVMRRVTAEGVGFTVPVYSGSINGQLTGYVNLASVDDYAKLLSNVQQLADDVAAVRNTLNVLIQQLKA